MRFALGFVLLLAPALAQPFIDAKLVDYFSLTPAQSASLVSARTDFSTYLGQKQARLGDIQRAIADARNSESPDPADIGRLYVEYEGILREILVRAAGWNGSAAAFLTSEQASKLNALKRASSISQLIFEAQLTNLIGPTVTSTPSALARNNYSGSSAISVSSSLQGYLGLSNGEVSAMQNTLLSAYRDSAALQYQIDLANLAAQRELRKITIDPLTVGLIVTQMDAAFANQTSGSAQIRKDLLAALTPAQLQMLRVLDDLAAVLPLASTASCAGLLALDLRNLTLAPGGAVVLDVNQLPGFYIRCYLY